MSEPIKKGSPRDILRTCVGCRRRAPRSELVRIALDARGSVALDPAGHAPGRGAYVCSCGQAAPSGAPYKESCLELAARGRLGRALRAPVGAAEIERLKREFVS